LSGRVSGAALIHAAAGARDAKPGIDPDRHEGLDRKSRQYAGSRRNDGAHRAGGAQPRNMVENLALFAAVLVAAWMAGAPASRRCLPCALFFWARLACFPIYVAGIPYRPTAIWSVSVAGLAMPAWEALTMASS
jgi:uncharacterized MAPEG superfamily protein